MCSSLKHAIIAAVFTLRSGRATTAGDTRSGETALIESCETTPGATTPGGDSQNAPDMDEKETSQYETKLKQIKDQISDGLDFGFYNDYTQRHHMHFWEKTISKLEQEFSGTSEMELWSALYKVIEKEKKSECMDSVDSATALRKLRKHCKKNFWLCVPEWYEKLRQMIHPDYRNKSYIRQYINNEMTKIIEEDEDITRAEAERRWKLVQYPNLTDMDCLEQFIFQVPFHLPKGLCLMRLVQDVMMDVLQKNPHWTLRRKAHEKPLMDLFIKEMAVRYPKPFTASDI